MTRAPLTPVEQEVYRFLLDFLSTRTFQPSVREIAKHCRIPSTKSVTDLLASLERKGYVERAPGRSRGVTLVGFGGGAGTIPVPVLRVEAGRADLPSDDHLTLDRRLVPSDDAFLVRASHEHAPRHGVRLGDLVLVHPSSRAKDGDVVAVRVANVVLVRTMRRRGLTLLLEAPGAGDDRELGPGDDYVVLGVLAGVIRAASPA
ncbi:MAG TPA: S24 family peptidase [Gemmatimonadaceae bacterium]|nr:S24 family peptidase [Gemmatimonadaceae bacterium]